MEIRITKIFTKGGYISPEDNAEDWPEEEAIIALITHDDGKKTSLTFDQMDMSEIDEFLQIEGWAGHIPFHEWLKMNKPDYFKQNITDSDREGIVLKLLAELKDFLKIKI